MILTVTLNPALDLTYAVDALVPHTTHRVRSVAERAGGKGLNVARVLHAAGEPVLATGLLGGATGAAVRTLAAAEGLPSAFVPIGGETRRTVSIVHGADATGLWEPGPTVTAGEWAAFVAHYAALVAGARVVTLSGSLPAGLPPDAYAVLIRLARDHGVPAVLDTSGAALRHGLAAGPDLIKPNADELAALLAPPETGRPETGDGGTAGDAGDADEAGDVAAVRGLLAGGCRAVVVSQGRRGLLAVTGAGTWRAAPPAVVAGNPTGAGDACVAALARGLRDRTPWPDLLADAVAMSAAAVAAPVAGAIDADHYADFRTRVTVTPA